MIPHAEYLVRPPYLPGESVAGYLYRFYGANGHRVPGHVSKLLTALRSRRSFDGQLGDPRDKMFQRMQQLLGTACILDEGWWIEGDYIAPYYLCGRATLSLCPECIQMFGAHLAIWDLPLITACPIHRCRLVAQCPKCRAQLRWARLQPDWHCGCGQDICQIPTRIAGNSMILLSWCLIGAGDTPRPPSYSVDPPAGLAFPPLQLETAYRLLQRCHALRASIIEALWDARPADRRQSRYFRSRPRPGPWEARALVAWPTGLHEALVRLLQRRLRPLSTTLVEVSGDPVIKHVLKHLGNSASGDWPIDEIGNATRTLIEHFRAPVARVNLVLFNPRLGVERCRERLRHFSLWCGEWAPDPAAIENPPAIERPVGYPMRERDRERIAVEIVSRLVDAASEGKAAGRYASLLRACYKAEDPSDPLNLVRSMTEELARLPYFRLDGLVHLLNAVEYEGRA